MKTGKNTEKRKAETKQSGQDGVVYKEPVYDTVETRAVMLRIRVMDADRTGRQKPVSTMSDVKISGRG